MNAMAIDPYREAARLMQARDWPNALTQIDCVLLASWRHYTAQLASLSSALESAGVEL